MKIQNELDAEILKHKAEGKANKEVAPLVNLTVEGVNTNRQTNNLACFSNRNSQFLFGNDW
jgi:hypothetical protein